MQYAPTGTRGLPNPHRSAKEPLGSRRLPHNGGMSDSPPLGEPLPSWKPARMPDRITLEGRLVNLVPVDPEVHAEALYVCSHDPADPELWTYLFVGPFPNVSDFRGYLETVATSPTDIFFTIVDRATGRPAGIASYLRIEPQHGVIEIGHIWFGVALQRTPGSTEAMYLLARHAFDDLGHRRLEWKCDALNRRSCRAAERLGFTFEGVFRQHMVNKGRNRDTAWYGMLDGDWPSRRHAFEAWLAPANFDAKGIQVRSLAEIRERSKFTAEGQRSQRVAENT
jgi:RimJ/RimL family protein N-acetyltransferase